MTYPPPPVPTGPVPATGPARIEQFRGQLLGKLRDPVDFAGQELDAFGVNVALPLNAAAAARSASLADSVHRGVCLAVAGSFATGVHQETVDYDDAGVPQEPPRRFLRVRTTTARGTRVTTFFRCMVGGSTLYVAADHHLLAPVSVRRVVLWALALLFPCWLALTMPLLGSAGLVSALFLVAVVVALTPWRTVLRGVAAGHGEDALRTAFPRSLRTSTFDVDDLLLHLKTFSPGIAAAVREACREHGMDMETTDELLAEAVRKMATAGSSVVNNYGNNYGNMVAGNVGGNIGNNRRRNS